MNTIHVVVNTDNTLTIRIRYQYLHLRYRTQPYRHTRPGCRDSSEVRWGLTASRQVDHYHPQSVALRTLQPLGAKPGEGPLTEEGESMGGWASAWVQRLQLILWWTTCNKTSESS